FAEQNLQAAAGSVPSDTGSVDTTANDGDIDLPEVLARHRRSPRHQVLLRFFSGFGSAAAAEVRAFAGFELGDCRPYVEKPLAVSAISSSLRICGVPSASER